MYVQSRQFTSKSFSLHSLPQNRLISMSVHFKILNSAFSLTFLGFLTWTKESKYILQQKKPEKFRSKISRCTTHLVESLRRSKNFSEPKICEFHVKIFVQEYILGFNVSVNYIFSMTVLHCKKNLKICPIFLRSFFALSPFSLLKIHRIEDNPE